MQNRYVGDVGDFGKYGLVRALIRSDLRLGIVWYLNPVEEMNFDGRFTDYLRGGNEGGFRECDPELYDQLRRLIETRKRNVQSVRTSGILPASTLYYEEPLTFAGQARIECGAYRTRWLCGALQTTVKAQIVFFDPDNGLPGKTAKPYSKNGPKYVFLEELNPYVKRGQSLVVYQHQNRTCPVAKQIEEGRKRLMRLTGHSRVWALSFHRKSVRIFFVVASAVLENILSERISEFAMGPWNKHFDLHR